MSVLDQIIAALDGAAACGRTPIRLVLGRRQAAGLERELYRPARIERGLFDEVIAVVPEFAPKIPYPLPGVATLFDVPIERVDEDDHLGVVGREAAS